MRTGHVPEAPAAQFKSQINGALFASAAPAPRGGYAEGAPVQRNWPAIRDKVNRCAQHFRLLDAMLAHRPFLCGDALTLADIPAGTSLYRYFELDIERPSVPNVEAWYRRLGDRPAYREHVMVPFDELRGRLNY